MKKIYQLQGFLLGVSISTFSIWLYISIKVNTTETTTSIQQVERNTQDYQRYVYCPDDMNRDQRIGKFDVRDRDGVVRVKRLDGWTQVIDTRNTPCTLKTHYQVSGW